MKRVLILALVAVAGVLAAGSSVKADHFRYVGHHHHGGGFYGGYNRGYSAYRVRPYSGVSIGIGYGAPAYGSYYGGYGGGYGGGYVVPSYGYSVPVYSAPVYSYGSYGGGYCR